MKRIAIILGVAVVLVLAIGLAIPYLVDVNQFRSELQTRLGQALGRQVTVSDLRLTILSGSVTATDLSIGEDPAFGKPAFLKAETLKVGVSLLPLILSRQVNVTGITLQKPEIHLIQSSAGIWNFASLGGNSPKAPAPKALFDPAPSKIGSSDFSIADVRVTDGRVTLERLGGQAKPMVFQPVDFEMKNFSEASSFPFSLTAFLSNGGGLKLNGDAGPINPGDVIETPFDAKLAVSRLDLAASSVVDPSTGSAGLVSIDGAAKSRSGSITINGKLKAEQVKLAKAGSPAKQALDIDLDLTHDLISLTGTIHQADVHIGSALARITGTYRVQSEPATLALKVSGTNMPMTDLAAILPAFDIVMPAGASIQGGTAQMNLASDGPLDKLVTSGTFGLENAKLANFDLVTKMKVLEELAGIKAEPHTTIQSFSTGVKNSPSGTVLDNVHLFVPSIGEMTGQGTISPSHELSFRMRVMVHSAVGALAAIGSKNGIPFTISGTSDNPSFAPDVKGLATDKLKDLTGGAGAAGGLLDSLFGGKKKRQ